MDKPTTPAEPNATPRPEDSGPEQDFGATGVFGVVKAPEPVKRPEPAWGATPGDPEKRVIEAPKPQPPPPPAQQPSILAEPVVHKVVFGGGAAASSPDLLDRMRMASAERAPVQQSAPAAEAAAQKAPAPPEPVAGGEAKGGFTQLLRTLEIDLPSQAAPEVTPASAARPAVGEKGLTSLLQTLGTSTPPESPVQRSQPAVSVPEKPPAAQGSGGFTELLRTVPAGDSEFGGPQTQYQPEGQTQAADWASKPVPTGKKPGTFTQLFSTLDGSGAPPPPEPRGQRPADSSGSGPGSFTQMLSFEQQSAPPAAAPPFAAASYFEERKPAAGSIDYGLTPQTARPAEASRDPFSPSPMPETPQQSAPPAGGVGITRLIRMLDEPSAAPAPIEAAPVNVPRGPEPGIWTQTFASLAEPAQPSAPAAKAPVWTPPAPPPPVVARDVTPPPASSAAGPSEFTRILDASRMRELAMQGGQAPAAPAAPPPPPQQSFALPAMPSYQVPVPPHAGGMPGYGAPPQPAAYIPPPMPQPQVMYAPPTPAMHVPTPPPMPAPAPRAPSAPTAPGTAKTQQYLLLMGGVIIFLLVAILVTVIFVMKH